MSFRTKEKRVGVQDFEVKEYNSQEDKKSKYLLSTFFLGTQKQWDMEDFDQTGLAMFLPVYHTQFIL